MNIFKGALIVGLALSFSQAENLKEVIELVLHNNENIQADQLITKSKQKTFESVKNIYNPKVNIGANYSKLDFDVSDKQVGSTLMGFIKFDMDLYDGGKNKALKKQKLYEYQASKFKNILTKKETILQIVNLYFNTQTVIENIKVFQEKSKALKAQYERMKTKYDMKMATIDEVLKLKSEYETNQYTIEELKYQKIELLKNISLLAGKEITSLNEAKLPEVLNLEYKPSENIDALKLDLKASEENINIKKSAKKVQIKLSDTLGIYKYNDYNDKFLTDLPSKQNQLNLSITYNLFDTAIKPQIEATKISKLASAKKLSFAKKQEKMNFILAKKKLHTQLLKINSLKSAVAMANSVYEATKAKYENGVVDDITYLDALSKKIYNIALYKQALNDYEIAKANYYFSSGIDYKKVLKEW